MKIVQQTALLTLIGIFSSICLQASPKPSHINGIWEYPHANHGEIARIDVKQTVRGHIIHIWEARLSVFDSQDKIEFKGTSSLVKKYGKNGKAFYKAVFPTYTVYIKGELDRGSLHVKIGQGSRYPSQAMGGTSTFRTSPRYSNYYFDRFEPSHVGWKTQKADVQFINTLPFRVEVYYRSKTGKYFVAELGQGQRFTHTAMKGDELVVIDGEKRKVITSTIADKNWKIIDLSRFSYRYGKNPEELSHMRVRKGGSVEMDFINERQSSVNLYQIDPKTHTMKWVKLLLPGKKTRIDCKSGDRFVLRQLNDNNTLSHVRIGDYTYQKHLIR